MYSNFKEKAIGTEFSPAHTSDITAIMKAIWTGKWLQMLLNVSTGTDQGWLLGAPDCRTEVCTHTIPWQST